MNLVLRDQGPSTTDGLNVYGRQDDFSEVLVELPKTETTRLTNRRQMATSTDETVACEQ